MSNEELKPLTRGANVQIVPKPFTGIIIKTQYNEDHEVLEYLVEGNSTDEDGNPKVDQRWCLATELEVI
jgi:hypothetical protein